MKKNLLLIIGLIALIALEILRVYFIMPFPGSQESNTIGIAYFLDRNIWWIRILLIIAIIVPLLRYLRAGKLWQKIVLWLVVAVYALIFYAFNFMFLADKMFYQPKQKLLVAAPADTTGKNKLIIGVALKGEAKAYPIEIIGYHHQVKDTLAGKPIMVTYCTVCRTGRVYSPFVNGQYELFRLVGMDHFNAMFEDATTKSWWQQATGVAVAGKLKGTALTEIPSQQMKLGDWMALYPQTFVLQPDSNFQPEYDSLKGYDEGTLKSSLEARDSASWQKKSWVVGVHINNESKAYDWNNLLTKKLIQDSFAGTPVLITTAPDGRSFYAFSRKSESLSLHFTYDTTAAILKDVETASSWQVNGVCIDGLLKGKRLEPLPAYQEFWHSWQQFHPGTKRYE